MDYETTYEKLYLAGYHKNPEFSNAKKLVEILPKHLAFHSILDIGCSHGWAVEQFLAMGKAAMGVDISQTAVDAANELGRTAVKASAVELPFSDNSYDVVMSTDAFEHLEGDDATKAINEAIRVSRIGVAMKISPHVDRGHWKEIVNHDLHLTVRPVNQWIQEFKTVALQKYSSIELVYQHNEIFIMKFKSSSSIHSWWLNILSFPKRLLRQVMSKRKLNSA